MKQIEGQLSLVRFFFGKEMNSIANTTNLLNDSLTVTA